MRLSILFLTVFVDLVGFGIVLPLLPLYADRFGASGTVVGVLVLSYSAAQLLFAPLWGRLSDRYGRRPVLIVGLLGSTLSYLVFAYAGSVWVLLLSRVMAGIGGANIPVAQAYIADVTPPEHRAANMGLIGAAFGLGFIFGPIIGGVLAPVSPVLPGLAAAGLCGGNAIVAFFLLPESLTVRERVRQMRARRAVAESGPAERTGGRTGRPEFRLVMGNPAFVDTLVLFFVFSLAFSIMHPILPLYASGRFGLGERAVGGLFAFLGIVSAVVQGIVVRVLVARTGEVALIRAAAVPFTAGFLVVGLASSLPTLLAGLALLALGFGGSLPSLVSLLSRSAPEAIQGGSLGIGQSAGALARVIGPFVSGVSWDLLGDSAPYFVATGFGIVAGLWGFRLVRPE